MNSVELPIWDQEASDCAQKITKSSIITSWSHANESFFKVESKGLGLEPELGRSPPPTMSLDGFATNPMAP